MEGSLEVILPTIWTDEKQRWEESEKRREEERRSKKRKPQKKDDPGARKSRKVAKPCMCLSNDLWLRRSQLARWEMKKCTPLWFQAHVQVKMYKARQPWTTFGSWDDEKLQAVVARSTFPSLNVQNTPCSDHFWKLRCRKSARRCVAKQISKSKCTKHASLGPLLEVEMMKKCPPLWHEAHFQVKMYKTHPVRTTFGSWDVEKVHAVVSRSTCRSQKCKRTVGYGALLDVQMSFRVAGARDCAPCQKWAKRK